VAEAFAANPFYFNQATAVAANLFEYNAPERLLLIHFEFTQANCYCFAL
jgi:hypothetical protein